MGHECDKFHKSLADKISQKKDELYSEVMRYMRMNISFLVLKSTLLCIRGSRTLRKTVEVGEDFSQALIELGL